jgi:hypothetical protein
MGCFICLGPRNRKMNSKKLGLLSLNLCAELQGRSPGSYFWHWLTLTRWFRKLRSWGLVCVTRVPNEIIVVREWLLFVNGAEIFSIGGGVGKAKFSRTKEVYRVFIRFSSLHNGLWFFYQILSSYSASMMMALCKLHLNLKSWSLRSITSENLIPTNHFYAS